MRMIFTLLAVLMVGALLGLLLGWPFGFAGGWYWWAGGGASFALIAGITFVLWDLLHGPNIIASLALALLAGAMLHPSPAAAAERIARQGDDSVRFLEAPCANDKVLTVILPAEVQFWQEARAVFDNQHFEACWREVRGAIFLIYEDGDRGIVPMRDVQEAGS